MLWFAASVAVATEERRSTIGLDEIVPGLEGYGLSVFSGTTAERFGVEVIGVMRNVSPQVSYILVRLEGQGLETSGVIGGMSGSPVYLDDRLAGAVAFSWNFSKEPIAGVTPIETMRELSSLPPGSSPSPAVGKVVELAQIAAGELPEELLVRELSRFRPELAGGRAGAVQFSTVGFSERGHALLERSLGPVAPAGLMAPDVEVGLEAGGAVAGVLVGGDLMLTVSGTVTDRFGDEVLALGHSFLGLGPLRLPMAAAEVLTVIPSVASSFKISNVGPVLGAFDQDRLPGMRGRIGAPAPTTPMRISVRGPQPREYNLQLADLPMMTPSLMAVALIEAVGAASHASGFQSLDLSARFELAGYDALEIRQNFDGANAATNVAIYVLSLGGYLLQNSLAEVQLERVDLEVTQSSETRTAALRGAHAERTQIEAGARLRLNLDFVAYRGEPFRRFLEIDTPEDLPPGPYYLFVGDGSSIDAARLQLEPAEPATFDQALARLRSFHSREELVVLGVFGGQGLVVGGEVLPRLPGSVRSLWQAAASTATAKPLRLAVAQEVVEVLDRPFDGLVRIDLEIVRPRPGTVEDSAPGGRR